MKHRTILFVCTGNTCRSPMAEAALRAELKRKRIRWYRVQSAGLRTDDGCPMSANAKQALTEAGIAFSADFASRCLTEKMVTDAYRVVCMTSAQRDRLGAFANVTSFPELCGMEIPDPYGCAIDTYRVTLRMIRDCLPRVIQLCCPSLEENSKSGETR